ncbi:Catalase [Blattella germanica]|nr:Catalase [Blattella germanica]
MYRIFLFYRNSRVFGIKFYTDDGNWDLLGAHAHRFFINDGLTFINNIHALGRNPATHLQDANSYWDFNTLQEQSIADILLFFSFLMLPDGFRHMHGHSLNTFKMVNKNGKAFYVRFHWIVSC